MPVAADYRTVKVLPDGRHAIDSITAIIAGRTRRRVTITEALVEAERIIRETDEADRKSA